MLSDRSMDTPWRAARLDGLKGTALLLFGRMYEDWTIEARVFPPKARVFCVASAGCTAMALAASGRRVTAVDINPAQVSYVAERLRGAPPRNGTVDRLLAKRRCLLAWLGMPTRTLREFLALDNPIAQVCFWVQRLETIRWRAMLRAVLSPLILRGTYARAFVGAVPRRLDRLVRRRLLRGWSMFANCRNPYAWRLFLGCNSPLEQPVNSSVRLAGPICADAAEYLENCRPGSFDAFSLSNILDGASPAYRRRLFSAMCRAAAPEAQFVLRSFNEPTTMSEDVWAGRDRAMLWGSIDVRGIKELGALT